MDGYHAHASGGEHVTYERLRAMGTNGFQKPAVGFEDGQIVGTKRLYADGKFGTEDGRALFCIAEWGGLQALGKEEQRESYDFLINNGRANLVWQSASRRSCSSPIRPAFMATSSTPGPTNW
jgi:arsenite oxidase large subunit